MVLDINSGSAGPWKQMSWVWNPLPQTCGFIRNWVCPGPNVVSWLPPDYEVSFRIHPIINPIDLVLLESSLKKHGRTFVGHMYSKFPTPPESYTLLTIFPGDGIWGQLTLMTPEWAMRLYLCCHFGVIWLSIRQAPCPETFREIWKAKTFKAPRNRFFCVCVYTARRNPTTIRRFAEEAKMPLPPCKVYGSPDFISLPILN